MNVVDRYLVVNHRNPDHGDMDDLYLLTLDQWLQFKDLRAQGQDVCMASSNVVEPAPPPYFGTYAKLFDHVYVHGFVLRDGEVGIGY